ncbi:hypothetical protein [Leptolyngbya sp. 7M]|uniref:hypothetical protein n=1 Tax=Leptolyngbya sp. 7M TaxID=2812896 RepID=UPI001B8CEA6C|nr:hypothetical protein [Leptolyngbya sp. 7M]QYO68937.1 hypothetical protein JVX88_15980 [Leptolyngbya sp. 7M]
MRPFPTPPTFPQGPLCKLHSPEQPLNLGATLHSTWLSAAEFATYQYPEPERSRRRKHSVEQDYEEVVVIAKSRGNQKIKDLFETIIYPHFVAQTSEAKLITQLKHPTKSAPAEAAPVDDTPAYADISPNGSVPAISENGLARSTTDAAATPDP